MQPLALRDLNDESPARRVERRLGAEKFGWKGSFANRTAIRVRSNAVWASPSRSGIALSTWTPASRCASIATARSKRSRQYRISAAASERCWRRSWPRNWGSDRQGRSRSATPSRRRVRPRAAALADHVDHAGRSESGDQAKQQLLQHVEPALKGTEPRVVELQAARGAAADRHGQCDGAAQPGVRPARGHLPRRRAVPAGRRRRRTSIVHVEHVLAVHDCGRPMNLLQLESQVNGGILQGIWLCALRAPASRPQHGHHGKQNLEQYRSSGQSRLCHRNGLEVFSTCQQVVWLVRTVHPCRNRWKFELSLAAAGWRGQ